MAFNPEKFVAVTSRLEKPEDHDQAQKELADLMAFIVGAGNLYRLDSYLRDKIEEITAHLPVNKRNFFIQELQQITKQVGWRQVHKIVTGKLNLDREVMRAAGLQDDVEYYSHTVRRPETITHFEDFMNTDGGPTHYWIPRKYDIQRYVQAAKTAHEASARSGPVKILDIGGGSGFLSKLIADELNAQGIESEVVVIDPDADTIQEAQKTFSNTQNLRFEVGTSRDALKRYGPELESEDKELFEIMEKRRIVLLERGREELTLIKATLAAFETCDDPHDVLNSAFGETAEKILKLAMVDSDVDMNTLKNTLADYYDKRRGVLQNELIDIADRQEALYVDVGVHDSKFDVVLNSWMPIGLDFTREIRMLSSPVIIYARERGGATGVEYPSDFPSDLGMESSYGTGFQYEEISSWEGVATSGVSGASRHGCLGLMANLSEIQILKFLQITEDDLELQEPNDDKKYAWEESLENLIGRRRMRDRDFY